MCVFTVVWGLFEYVLIMSRPHLFLPLLRCLHLRKLMTLNIVGVCLLFPGGHDQKELQKYPSQFSCFLNVVMKKRNTGVAWTNMRNHKD